MASFLRLGWLVLAGVAAAGAQKPTTLVEPPAPLLAAQAGTLKSADVTQKTAAEMGELRFDRPGCEIDLGMAPAVPAQEPCAAVLKEDGLTRLAGGTYAEPGSIAGAQVSAFEFGDATGAYSAYTFLRSLMKGARVVGAEARLGSGSAETSADSAGTLVWAGTAVLKVSGRVGKDALAAMVARLPKVGGSRGLAPLLPTELPGEGLDGASIRYAVGPEAYTAMGGVFPAGILGWDKSAEVATARYRGNGTLTMMMYPTPQIAGDRGRALEKAVADAGGPGKFGELRMRRVGPMLGATSGAFTARQADALIGALKLNQEVTFDKKKPLEFHAEVRKTASLLENIAVLSGVLILAAVLLGLFLGFGRAGIRVLMGKPAASEPEFLTINLRDKPKAFFAGKAAAVGGGDPAPDGTPGEAEAPPASSEDQRR